MPRRNLAVTVLMLCALAAAAGCGRRDGMETVRAAKVTRGDLRTTISASGEVKPQNRVEIKPPITGRIDKVLVREGQQVKAGDILAWMSSTERAALMDVARSQGPESMARWEEAYKAAPLIAPLDGTIILRAVEPGQTVTAADPVVVLADRLIVEALVDETDLSLIRVGQPVDVRLDAYPDQRIPAAVDHIAYEARIVNNVSVYPVDILPEEVPPTFRSGMTATVTFVVADRKDVLLIPSEGVSEWPKSQPRPEGASVAVYRRVKGQTVPVPVKIGESDGRMTEVLEGLDEGQEIAIVRRRESERQSNPFSRQRRPQERSR